MGKTNRFDFREKPVDDGINPLYQFDCDYAANRASGVVPLIPIQPCHIE